MIPTDFRRRLPLQGWAILHQFRKDVRKRAQIYSICSSTKGFVYHTAKLDLGAFEFSFQFSHCPDLSLATCADPLNATQMSEVTNQDEFAKRPDNAAQEIAPLVVSSEGKSSGIDAIALSQPVTNNNNNNVSTNNTVTDAKGLESKVQDGSTVAVMLAEGQDLREIVLQNKAVVVEFFTTW